MDKFLRQILNNKAFTFIELLLALSVVALLLLISVPLKKHLIPSLEERLFLETFHNDLLYVQKIAMASNQAAGIEFRDGYYLVMLGRSHSNYKRIYPKSLDISSNTIKFLSFNHRGTIKQAGTIRFKFKQKTFKYVCPLGKGRCYFEG